VKLTMMQRFGLIGLIPAEGGTFVQRRTLLDLRAKLHPSEKEVERLKIHEKDGQIMWDTTNEGLVEIEIGDIAKTAFAEALKQLETNGKLQDLHLELWERFVENK
jgi:hypothetical protein